MEGTEEVTVDSVEETTEPVVEETVEEVVEETTEEIVEETTEETTEESTEEPTEEEEVKEEVDEEPSLTVTDLKYGDLEVEAVIDEGVNNMLNEKGFDGVELTKALYDGEFGLPDETMQALYEAYGQFQVDTYLDALKAKADLLQYTTAEQTKAIEEANQARWDMATELVGGEQGWDNLQAWLDSDASQEVVTNEELAQFNEIMQDGTEYMQKLAIESLNNRYQNTLTPEQKELTLLEGDGGNLNPAAPETLTHAQYIELYSSQQYAKADAEQRAKWDEMRQRGIDKGL
jgi:hypothetical protein